MMSGPILRSAFIILHSGLDFPRHQDRMSLQGVASRCSIVPEPVWRRGERSVVRLFLFSVHLRRVELFAESLLERRRGCTPAQRRTYRDRLALARGAGIGRFDGLRWQLNDTGAGSNAG